MKRNIYFCLLAISLLSFQCSGEPTNDQAAETTEVEGQEAAAETPTPVVAQQAPDNTRSASEILESNGDRYAQLHRVVNSNYNTIIEKIDESTFPQKMKDGLKASFEEVKKYKDVTDIAQTSKYTSAETLEQFMNGLERYIERWGIK